MIKIPYFTNSLPNGSFALRKCPVGQVHRHFRWIWTGEESTTSPPTSTRLCLASAKASARFVTIDAQMSHVLVLLGSITRLKLLVVVGYVPLLRATWARLDWWKLIFVNSLWTSRVSRVYYIPCTPIGPHMLEDLTHKMEEQAAQKRGHLDSRNVFIEHIMPSSSSFVYIWNQVWIVTWDIGLPTSKMFQKYRELQKMRETQ